MRECDVRECVRGGSRACSTGRSATRRESSAREGSVRVKQGGEHSRTHALPPRSHSTNFGIPSSTRVVGV